MAQPQAKEQRNSLKGIAVFAGLSAEALERIERRCAWKRYAPGEPILDYLDASDDVFFLTVCTETHKRLGTMIVRTCRIDGNHRYSWTKNQRLLLVSWTRPGTLRRKTSTDVRAPRSLLQAALRLEWRGQDG